MPAAPVALYSTVDPSQFQLAGLRKGTYGMQIVDISHPAATMGKLYIQTPRFKRLLVNKNESTPEKTNLGLSLRDQEDFQTFLESVEDRVRSELGAKFPEVKAAEFASRISRSDKYPALFNANVVSDQGVKVFSSTGEEVGFQDFLAMAKGGSLDVRAIIEFSFVWVKGGRAGVSAIVRMLQYFEQEKLEGFSFLD